MLEPDFVEPWVMAHAASRRKALRSILNRFCTFSNLTPQELYLETRQALRNAERPPVKGRLVLWQDFLLRSGLGDKSVQTYRNVILSFLSWHELRIGKEISVQLDDSSSYESKYEVLEQKEVKRMFKAVKRLRYCGSNSCRLIPGSIFTVLSLAPYHRH